MARLHEYQGKEILAANGLLSDACSCFERAVALNPGYGEARNNLGRGLRSLGRADEAVTQFELLLKSTPDSPVAHFSLASVLEMAGVKDAVAKSLGSNNHANTVKATILGLSQMRSPKEVLTRRRQFSTEATIGR